MHMETIENGESTVTPIEVAVAELPAKLLTNLPLPQALEDYLRDNPQPAAPCFALVGDLTLDARYGKSALLFYPDCLVAYDSVKRATPEVYPYGGFKEAKVRRMYGNALFLAEREEAGARATLLRFTYAAAEVAEAAAEYVNQVNADGWHPGLLDAVKASYERQRSFCPKCGRKLHSPDAPCINCEGKSKMLKKLSVYVTPHMVMLFVCLALSVIQTSINLVPPKVTGAMVDGVLTPRGRAPLFGLSFLDFNLNQMVLFFAVSILMQWIIGAIRGYFLRIIGDKMIVRLKKDVYSKAQFLPMSFYDKTSTGSVITRINSDTSVLQGFILRMSQEAVTQLFLMLGLVVIMFVDNPKLATFSLAPIPLVVLGSRFFGRKIAPKYRRIWRRGAAIASLLADTIPGTRVIKAFTNESRTINKFENYCDDWLDEDRAVAKVSIAFVHVVGFFVACGSLVIWAVGGREVQHNLANNINGLTVGELVTFISYASMFYGPVNFFATINDSYQNALASVEKVLDILDAEPEHDFGKGDVPDRLDGRIEFQNVNFSFDRSKKVLTNVNLVIEPGDTVGIVGTTGSGKSTLINLLMRYYDDYDGEIFVDGKNLKEIDMQYYRGQIGYVQQEPLMFRDTVFNNIAYGAGKVHVEQVLSAAEVANAHGFIARLPDAYDTMLGERGTGLSGGERQRVSIARAVLKNPSLLILDEATAAVDSETEHLIQEAIERLIRGRTTLMIAHRLSTLRKANKIIVVDKGEIIEFGSPQELMERKGKYYKLVKIQTMAEEAESQRQAEKF